MSISGGKSVSNANSDGFKERAVPMKVLCFGMPRTGTSSLRTALLELGYNGAYHMLVCMIEDPSQQEIWLRALRAKFRGDGTTFTKRQWDEFLGDYMAVVDVPCLNFWPELLEAYPDAKVILTTRPVDTWHKSVMNTIWKFSEKLYVPTWNPFRRVARMLLPSTPFIEFFCIICDETFGPNFPVNGKQKFLDHNEAIRRAVPKERLLEFNVKEGWGPLCKFLGDEEPQTPFPRVNDTAAFQDRFRFDLAMMDVASGLKLVTILGLLGGVAYAAQRYHFSPWR